MLIYLGLCWVSIAAWPSSVQPAGALHLGSQASHCRSFSCAEAWAPGARGPQAHVGSPSRGLRAPGRFSGCGTQVRLLRVCSLLRLGIEPVLLAGVVGALLNHWTTRKPSQGKLPYPLSTLPYISPQLAQSRSWSSQAPMRLLRHGTPGTCDLISSFPCSSL